jgi:acyl carrier protein
MEEYREKIRSFIEANLVVFEDEAEFADADNIFEMGFVNSLFAMKLLNYVENEFGVEVDNEDMEISNFSSVDNIMNFVQSKKGGGGGQ